MILKESGWFLVRALSDVKHTFRFASTAPYFAQVGNVERRIHRSDVEFYLEWIRERMRRIRDGAGETIGDPEKPENREKLESVLEPHRRALEAFEARLKEAVD